MNVYLLIDWGRGFREFIPRLKSGVFSAPRLYKHQSP